MNTSDLYDSFRSEMVLLGLSMVVDAEIYRYMDEAYRNFVRLTGGVADFSSSATEVDIEAGEPLVTLHPSILRITRVTRASDGGEIKLLNFSDVAGNSAIALSDTRGTVKYLLIGSETNVGRWIQVPAVNDSATLMIHRLPLNALTGPGQKLSDVAGQHHLALLDWMKHLFFKRPGTEYFNMNLAESFATSFGRYCAQASREIARQKHKNRVVAYGGI